MSKNYKEYDDLGVRFIYPSNWFVQTETWDKGTHGITVDSPEGSFWSLAIYPKGVDLDDAAKKILGTLHAEYDEIDESPVKKYVADRILTGYEINFFYLDLVSSAIVLKFEDERRGYVVFWQMCDRLTTTGETLSRSDIFDAMTHTFVSNLTGQEIDYWDENDNEFQFGAAIDEKTRREEENREFLRRKYERMHWEEEQAKWRDGVDDEENRGIDSDDENDDETFRRAVADADEKLEDFLRNDEDEERDEYDENNENDDEFDKRDAEDENEEAADASIERTRRDV